MRLVAAAGGEDTAPPSLIEQAEAVLAFLNQKTGRKYAARTPNGAATANADLIYQRLKDGYSVEDLRSVIALKCRQWGQSDKMRPFLRPQTLFARSKFETYIGELEE